MAGRSIRIIATKRRGNARLMDRQTGSRSNRMSAQDGSMDASLPLAAMTRMRRSTICSRFASLSVLTLSVAAMPNGWGAEPPAAGAASSAVAVAILPVAAVQAAPDDPLAAPSVRLRQGAEGIIAQLHAVATPAGSMIPAASIPPTVRSAASLQQALQQIDRVAAAGSNTDNAACRQWLCDALGCLKQRLIELKTYEAASAYAAVSATQLLASEQIGALENVDAIRRQQEIAAGSGFASGQASGIDALEIQLLDAAVQTVAANRLARERLLAITDASWACDFTAECFVAAMPAQIDPCLAGNAAVATRCELRSLQAMARLIRCDEACVADLLSAMSGIYHSHLGCLLPQIPAQPHLSLLPWVRAEQMDRQETARTAAAATADAIALELRETISQEAVVAAIGVHEAAMRMELAEQAMLVAQEAAENLDRVAAVRRVEPSERYAAESDLATRRIDWLRRIAERNQAILDLRYQTGTLLQPETWISESCPSLGD